MKKLSLLIILIMFCSFGFSQSYHKFIEKNKKWWIDYTCDGMGGCSNITNKGMLYYFEGDTIINSTSYKVLKSKVVWSSLITIGWTNKVGYYREDSINKKVYIYYFGRSGYKIPTREILLYDFNLKIGDSFNSMKGCPQTMNSLIVTKIDTIITTNANLRKFIFNDNSSYVESVGSINPATIITDTFTVCIGDYPVSTIQCVKTGDNIIYGNNCVNTALKKLTTMNIDILPTIMTDKLRIEMNSDTFADLNIYSVNGWKVVTKKLYSNNEEISVRGLTSGMYYYVLYDNNGIIKTGKLIKK